jgi:hypothetical protein
VDKNTPHYCGVFRGSSGAGLWVGVAWVACCIFLFTVFTTNDFDYFNFMVKLITCRASPFVAAGNDLYFFKWVGVNGGGLLRAMFRPGRGYLWGSHDLIPLGFPARGLRLASGVGASVVRRARYSAPTAPALCAACDLDRSYAFCACFAVGRLSE